MNIDGKISVVGSTNGSANVVSIVGNTPGIKGNKGDAATIDVGSTTTGLPGTSASVTNVGTTSSAVLNFVIPAGQSIKEIVKKSGTGAAGTDDVYSVKITDNSEIGTFSVHNGADGQGTGDMNKSTYDSNSDGIVNSADKLSNGTYSMEMPTLTKNEVVASVSNILTKTSQLDNDSNFVSDSSYVHTDNNFTTDLKTQIGTNTTNIDTLAKVSTNNNSFINLLANDTSGKYYCTLTKTLTSGDIIKFHIDSDSISSQYSEYNQSYLWISCDGGTTYYRVKFGNIYQTQLSYINKNIEVYFDGSCFNITFDCMLMAIMEVLGLNVNTFSESSTYGVGTYVTFGGRLWKCSSAVTTAGAWTGSTNWTQSYLFKFN